MRAIPLQEVVTFLVKVVSIYMSVLILLADGVFLGAYTTIIVIILRQRTLRHSINTGRQKLERKILILCLSVVLVFTFCTTPFVIVHLAVWKVPAWLVLLNFNILPVNSAVNSIVYLWQNYAKNRKTILSIRRKFTNGFNVEVPQGFSIPEMDYDER